MFFALFIVMLIKQLSIFDAGAVIHFTSTPADPVSAQHIIVQKENILLIGQNRKK